MDKCLRKLATYGWVRGEKGNQKRYNGVMDYLGLQAIPKTPTGDYSMREEDLKPFDDACNEFSNGKENECII